MTDLELRALVRDAVARHLGRPGPAVAPSTSAAPLPATQPYPTSPWQQHPSHHLYLPLVNADTACVIEPSVQCDHCGYCRSHGH